MWFLFYKNFFLNFTKNYQEALAVFMKKCYNHENDYNIIVLLNKLWRYLWIKNLFFWILMER